MSAGHLVVPTGMDGATMATSLFFSSIHPNDDDANVCISGFGDGWYGQGVFSFNGTLALIPHCRLPVPETVIPELFDFHQSCSI